MVSNLFVPKVDTNSEREDLFMHCTKCGAEIAENSAYCAECGAFLGLTVCPDCGAKLTPGAAFCPGCGKDLPKAPDQPKAAPAAQTAQAQQPTIVINNTNTNTNANKNNVGGMQAMTSPKSRWLALALCLFGGWLGIHRFYVGKIGTGILYLCTFGLFGIGWFIDFFVILFGSFRDKYGLWLRH